jgi:putative redox protein
MAVKTVKVESVLDAKFKLESTVHGHKVIVDQPANAGGTDAGPTPLDYLLVSLAGCIGTIGRIVAMQKRITLRGMKITVEGDINTDGLLGKPTDDPVGFKEFRILADIDADLTAEEKEAFVHEVDARCPVSFNLLNNTPVKISAL